MTTAPVITTTRLRLRPHTMEDIRVLMELAGSARAEFMGGRIGPIEAWRLLAAEVACWALMDMGPWGIERRSDEAFLGQVCIMQPPHFPEVEIGWTLTAEAEGHGYAYEAARAALDWAWNTGRFPTLVSYIGPDNARSIALAERLGAYHDPAAHGPHPDDRVYRHDRAAMEAMA